MYSHGPSCIGSVGKCTSNIAYQTVYKLLSISATHIYAKGSACLYVLAIATTQLCEAKLSTQYNTVPNHQRDSIQLTQDP